MGRLALASRCHEGVKDFAELDAHNFPIWLTQPFRVSKPPDAAVSRVRDSTKKAPSLVHIFHAASDGPPNENTFVLLLLMVLLKQIFALP